MRTHVAFTINRNNKRHPGARAIEPSADDAYSKRGKLYIVVELFPSRSASSDESGGGSRYKGADIAQANQQILDGMWETYYTENGSLSQVVRATISKAHLKLNKINSLRPDAPFGAGVCVAALLGNRLAIASSGSVISLLSSGESIQQFPSEVSGRQSGIGGSDLPVIQIYQHDWSMGGSLFLGSAQWLTYVSQRELLGTVAHLKAADSQGAAARISQQSNFAAVPGLFLTVGDTAKETIGGIAGDQATVQPSIGGLPTAVHATTHGQQSSQPSKPPTLYADPATTPLAEQMHPRDQMSPSAIHSSDGDGAKHLPKYRPDHSTQKRGEAVSAVEQSIEKEPSFIGRIGAALDRMIEPQGAKPATSIHPSEEPVRKEKVVRERVSVEDIAPQEQTTRERVKKENPYTRPSRPPMMSEAEYAESKGWNNAAATKPLYIEPKPATGSRTRLFILLAVLIALLIPLIIFASMMSEGVSERAKAETLIDAAAQQINSAESALDTGDERLARAELTKAEKYLIDAETLKGDRNRISQLKARAQRNLQSVLQIVPFYGLVEPLARFPSDASPSRVMIVNQDIYILDVGLNHILRLRLDANGETVPNPEGDIILRQGDQIDGAVVGPLIDMAWQAPSVGNEEKSNLIVLDSNNQVFRFNQIVDGASRLTFGSQQLWNSPTQIQSYIGRFYIADSGQGQIYRYTSGNFTAEPDEWLDSPASQSLAGLLSMSIDGDIWMLFSNGQLVRYQNGLAQPFLLDSDVGQITNPVDVYIGDQEDSLIYLADAGADRILVFEKTGAYLRQHQAAEGTPLRDLRGIFVDEITSKIYLLTKSSLYQHTLSE